MPRARRPGDDDDNRARSRGAGWAASLTPRALLDAGETADIVDVPARTVLAIQGTGAPESDAFRHAMATLRRAARGVRAVMDGVALGDADDTGVVDEPLELRLWVEPPWQSLLEAPRDLRCWRMRIAAPPDVRSEGRRGGKARGAGGA